MIEALGRAVADLANRRVVAIMLQALAISLLVFVFAAIILVRLLSGADPCALVGIDSCPLGLGTGAIGAIALTLIAAWFLFPAVAITVIAGFTDRIAAAVEQARYPEAAKRARPIGVGRGLLLGLKSGGRLILFVVVNGIGFGRDVAEIAAARHGDRASRRAWLKRTRGQQHLIGVVVSVLFLVPFANLIAPVIGTAAGIHLFNGSFWRADRNNGPLERRRSRSGAR